MDIIYMREHIIMIGYSAVCTMISYYSFKTGKICELPHFYYVIQ
jgi:hypothetical protein